MKILMFRDISVYDIENDLILDAPYAPFLDLNNSKAGFETWNKSRAYLKANRTAERNVQKAGGENTVEAKRRLSLSDCYWIKYNNDADVSFYNITPYRNDFSVLTMSSGHGNSSSVPDLVLGGSQPKQWERDGDAIYMSKAEQSEQIHAEMCAVKLGLHCHIPIMDAFVKTSLGNLYAKDYPLDFDYSRLGLIHVVNMTNEKESLVQFDHFGVGVDGFDFFSIRDTYIRLGVDQSPGLTNECLRQILFDAVVGNTDRQHNNSNWAVMIGVPGAYRRVSPLYDFNWANLTSVNTEMMDEVVFKLLRGLDKAVLSSAKIVLNMLKDGCEELGFTLWKNNAAFMLDKISDSGLGFGI